MKRTRIFYSDNGTLNDFSLSLRKFRTGTESIPDFVAAEDYMYIGNVAPFNFFYVKFATANTNSANLNIEYWDGSDWVSAAEVIDGTEGFTQDGYVEFVPDQDESWDREDTNNGGNNITGLTSVTIYDLYWVRISIDADLTATSLQFIGQKFSDDDDMVTEYPDLLRSNVLTAFEAGKTDWEEQHVRSAELVVHELISSNIIWSKNQILDRDTFKLAAVSKTAELVYNSFGDDFFDQRKEARTEYQDRINNSIYNVDIDEDGELSPREMRARQGFLAR